MADEQKETKETLVVEKSDKNNGLVIAIIVIIILLALFWIFGNPFGGSNSPDGGGNDINDVNIDTQSP